MMDPAPKPVRCTCGKVFCFMCGEVPHEPATCKMMKDWAKKLADDSETANFMVRLSCAFCTSTPCTRAAFPPDYVL